MNIVHFHGRQSSSGFGESITDQVAALTEHRPPGGGFAREIEGGEKISIFRCGDFGAAR
jgi:hypothetical protein